MAPEAFKRALVAALADHLSTGRPPRIPAGGEQVWRWFLDLNATRGPGFAGPLPITWGEIEAYRRTTGWPIEPRHVELIMALDRTLLQETRAGDDSASAHRADRPGLTEAAFDAMFG